MEDISAERIKLDAKQLSEEELDAIYFYLSLEFDSMKEEDQIFWSDLLSKIDKKFYED